MWEGLQEPSGRASRPFSHDVLSCRGNMEKKMVSPSSGNCYPDNRRFVLQPNEGYGFFVGTAGNQQVLVKSLNQGILVIAFSLDGHLTDHRVISVDRKEAPDEAATDVFRQIGFQQLPIQVHRFYLQDYQIGIRDLPQYLEDYIVNPDVYLADLAGGDKELEMIDLSANLADWVSKGYFVFHHDDEYWMDKDGNVLAH